MEMIADILVVSGETPLEQPDQPDLDELI